MRRKSALIVFSLLALFVLAMPLLAQAGDEPNPPIPLTVAAAVVMVLAVVQFIKEKVIPKIWDKLGDAAKFVFTVLASAGVTFYKYVFLENLPLNFGAITFCIKVMIAAYFGYEVLKGVAPTLSRSVKKPG